MTMSLPASTPAPAKAASFDQILRIIIALVGVIEGLGGLTDLPILFGDISTIPGFRRAAWRSLPPTSCIRSSVLPRSPLR